MDLNISDRVRHKLTSRHGVSEVEIQACFANRQGNYLKDVREEHESDPPTLWFIAETDHGRKLKIVFMQEHDGSITIKTAYEANEEEVRIYGKFGLGS